MNKYQLAGILLHVTECEKPKMEFYLYKSCMCWQFPKMMTDKLFDQVHCLVWQHHSHSTQFKFQVVLFTICINLGDC